MPTGRASTIEFVSLVAIAIAVLIGGASVLQTISHAGVLAFFALFALTLFQIATLRRDFAARTDRSRLLVTRDIIFLAAIAAALAFVAKPQRWAIGATVVAVEFGLVIEILARFAPRDDTA